MAFTLKKNNSLVSIILPTYNRQQLLQQAIRSVLAQSYDNWELIVWDDGSSDNSKDVVMSFEDHRIFYYFADNMGAAAARNQAISRAKGEYLAFLDSDDEWVQQKLSIQVSTLQAHPTIELLFSDFKNINLVQNTTKKNFEDYQEAFRLLSTEELEPSLIRIESGFNESLTRGNYIATDTIILKRNLLGKYGFFNESLRNSEDFELWWRLGLNNVRMAYHKLVLMTRYKPQGSLTSLTPESAASAIKALDLCAKEAISANRAELVDYLKPAYRNAWQNMITACAMENDKKGMMEAFKKSLKYGFRPGSLRLLVEGMLKIGVTRWQFGYCTSSRPTSASVLADRFSTGSCISQNGMIPQSNILFWIQKLERFFLQKLLLIST